MNILVTGASGFVGTHLVEHLSRERRYSQIHCLTFGDSGARPGTVPHERYFNIDLRDSAKVQEILKKVKPDRIVHLAAFAQVGTSFANPQMVLENNILITVNLLEAIKVFARKARVLIIGSADEYGIVQPEEVPIREEVPLRPTSPYAVSKVTVDYLGLQYFLAHQLKVVRLRPFNHIGEYQGEGFAVADFAKQIVEVERGRQEKILVGNLSAVRDFTDVKDIVVAYDLALEKCVPGEVYNVGSGKGVRMQDLLNMMLAKATTTIRVEVDTRRYRPVDVETVVCDTTKFHKETGWRPRIPLEDTLDRVLHYWRKKRMSVEESRS